jgi:DNA processing protein
MLERLGGPDRLLRAGREALLEAGLPLDLAAQVLSSRDLACSSAFVLAGEPAYPRALHLLPYAPPVLFYRGNLQVLERPAVAIVGARRCTQRGRRSAAELARAVSLAGGVVVSGMAIGIDTAAHREAMVHGPTVAVLGQGLAAPHSAGALRLRDEIVAGGGLVLSELPPETVAQRFTFLQRNRVIAGLCRATVVVEAAARSGALSTARHALEAGREVLAVPGHYGDPSSAGCLAIIDQGATLLRSPATLLDAAGLIGAEGVPAKELPPAALMLDDALQRGGTIEQLAGRAGIPVVQAISILTELELAGLVRRLPGQRYQRT